MDERQLSIDEQFMKITVTESNRDHFVTINTSTLAEVESRPVDGEWFFVHPIRYGGSFGGRNQWGL